MELAKCEYCHKKAAYHACSGCGSLVCDVCVKVAYRGGNTLYLCVKCSEREKELKSR